jgi:hypothetical protein
MVGRRRRPLKTERSGSSAAARADPAGPASGQRSAAPPRAVPCGVHCYPPSTLFGRTGRKKRGIGFLWCESGPGSAVHGSTQVIDEQSTRWTRHTAAGREFCWQVVSPAATLCVDPRAGPRLRRLLRDRAVSCASGAAVPRAGLGKRASTHSPRPAFATHLLAGRYENCTVQALRGHASLETTRIYPHVRNTGRCPVRSPLDSVRHSDGIDCGQGNLSRHQRWVISLRNASSILGLRHWPANGANRDRLPDLQGLQE